MDSPDALERPQLTLTVLNPSLAICQLPRDADFPQWAQAGPFFSLTRTEQELSITCAESQVPAGVACEGGWRALTSPGPLGFTLTGLLESLAEPLAVAGISIFVISTYNTDYLLVKEADLDIAILALHKAGHTVLKGGQPYVPQAG